MNGTYPATHGVQPPAEIPIGTRLSNRQHHLLTAINVYQRRHHLPPTIRDLQRWCGISSTSVVVYNLDVLVKAGLITHHPGAARAYRLANRQPCPHCDGTGTVPMKKDTTL